MSGSINAAYVDKDYVYAIARVRSSENTLLSQGDFSRLLKASDCSEAIRLLKGRGWGKESSSGSEELLKDEREKLWNFIDEIVPDSSVFDIFKLPNDYNNLKAAIKETSEEETALDIYISEFTVDPRIIKKAIAERNFADLPPIMADAAERALTEFLKIHDGQLCDAICDRACLESISQAAALSKDDFLISYAKTYVSSINIKIAVRGAIAGKTRDFFELAIAPCDALNREALINAASGGMEQITAFLSESTFSGAVNELKSSVAAFERWCDDFITENSKKEHLEFFGIGPIAAYILAKENEIKSVRILLSGKLNGFMEGTIAERMRECYV